MVSWKKAIFPQQIRDRINPAFGKPPKKPEEVDQIVPVDKAELTMDAAVIGAARSSSHGK
jgi:hypothetical protein